jgi:hypothetical protein
MRKSLFAYFLFLLFSHEISAQITWISKPRDFQFVCRNLNTQKGKVVFEGWVNQSGFSSVQIDHKGTGGALIKYILPLTYNSSGQAYFYQVIYVNAGKINHEFGISLQTGAGSTPIETIKKIACGDAYLISGQSNSVANSYNGLSNTYYRDSFIRSYGSSSPSVAGAMNDTGWYLADGDGIYNKGCVGQWGLVFARHVLDSTGIPVCIINAGVGGTPITFHQKNLLNAEDLNTNYGRMLYRARKAGLQEKIRGIFWFQGESDGSNAVLHDTLFRKMHTNWFKDYRGMEKVAVVQVRSGCGGPSLQLREKQRLFENLGRTVVISANGLNAHDGCHYWFKNGYEKLGTLLFQQLKTQLYNLKSTPENQPLNPYLVYFSNGSKTELCVEMTPLNATLKTDVGFHRLFSVAGGSVAITGGYLKNNKVYLTLSGSGCGIKYLNYDGLAGNQPWVTTQTDAALISFYNFPVLSVKPLPNITICRGDYAILGDDSIAGNTYSWKGVLSGISSKLAKPILKVPRSEKFWCIMKSTATGCLYDTFSQNVVVDTISPASLPTTKLFCEFDSVTIGHKNSDWAQGLWTNKSKGSSQQGFIIRVADTGLWYFLATSLAGCKTRDTISLRHYPKAVKHLPANLELCKGSSLKLVAPFKSSGALWNRNIYSDTFNAASDNRKIHLQYFDSNLCFQKDSVSIVELIPGSIQIDSQYSLCKGDTLLIAKPVAFTHWNWDGKSIPADTMFLSQQGLYAILLQDSRGCLLHHNLNVNINPVYELNDIDTGMCTGDSLKFVSPRWMNSWRWNNIVFQPGFYLKNAGIYKVDWIDSNQCKGEALMNIKNANKPHFMLPSDTFFCQYDSLGIYKSISNGLFEFSKGKRCSYPIYFTKPGTHTFISYNQPFCQSKHEMTVSEKPCINNTVGLHSSSLSISNHQQGLRILNPTSMAIRYSIFSITAQLMNQGEIGNGQETVIGLKQGVYLLGIENTINKKNTFSIHQVY